ncbi:MAG: 50S ribosomal protein L25, partial [Verrucomicrobia bacterium]|nr:50S ribosomal protein L25 [Verrucomicrobiota bacterium]
MKSVSLKVYPRSLVRRRGVKKVRATGRVPAIIYGRQAQPQNLEIGQVEITRLISHSASENILVDLHVEGDARAQRLALVQQVQHHPLGGQVVHVDFHEVSETERVTITVPVETVGEAIGVRTNGGVLEHVLFKVKARALPKDLPEVITVDVSPLEIGQTIHLGEIPIPPGVEILGDKKIPVISVAAPVTEEQEAAAAAAAAEGPLEPEVIREKKEEGEEAAEEGKPAGKTAIKPA